MARLLKTGAIFAAVCALLVVAPPISKGNLQIEALHLASNVDHFVQRRRDQTGETNGIGFLGNGSLENFSWHHPAQIDDLADCCTTARRQRYSYQCRERHRDRRENDFALIALLGIG